MILYIRHCFDAFLSNKIPEPLLKRGDWYQHNVLVFNQSNLLPVVWIRRLAYENNTINKLAIDSSALPFLEACLVSPVYFYYYTAAMYP